MTFNPPAGMALIPAGSYTMGNSIGDGALSPMQEDRGRLCVLAFYMDSNSLR